MKRVDLTSSTRQEQEFHPFPLTITIRAQALSHYAPLGLKVARHPAQLYADGLAGQQRKVAQAHANGVLAYQPRATPWVSGFKKFFRPERAEDACYVAIKLHSIYDDVSWKPEPVFAFLFHSSLRSKKTIFAVGFETVSRIVL